MSSNALPAMSCLLRVIARQYNLTLSWPQASFDCVQLSCQNTVSAQVYAWHMGMLEGKHAPALCTQLG